MSIPMDYWVAVDHEAWDEMILFYADTAQGAEDAAMAFIKEQVMESNDGVTEENWEDIAFNVGEWRIKQASCYKGA